MTGRGILHLLAVSAVVMGMAQTLARERIFLPLRERFGGKETWFGYLVSCPYCLSHYLAFALVPITDAYYLPASPRLGPLAPIATWFLSSILVVVVAAFMRVAFWFVDETQGLVRRQQRTEEEEAAVRRATRVRLEREEDRPPRPPH
ncbi:MAG TPA: hypothetical protein VFP65_13505 [Anaeromyxobacteraceae bacterium]|nr:hypothetical protein [Anaeromyxobacteraceae bacterium]